MRCDTFRSYWASSVFMFQSTHLHEVWHGQQAADAEYKRFNPHTYMRCDQSTICTNQHWTVSIHTPTWGVTLFTSYLLLSTMFQSTHLHEVWQSWQWMLWTYNSFNPHTYMRCDKQALAIAQEADKFQSTHLHEVWPGGFHLFFRLGSFNPHTYMRCDSYKVTEKFGESVSIHTPTWGVTAIIFKFLCSVWFQSTHLHEVWLQ